MTVPLLTAALLGLVMGSFSDCAAVRIASGETFLRGRSHCDACGRTLTASELIPVVSWLALGGRCRSCGAPIPVSCPVSELFCALTFAALAWRYGWTAETLEYLILMVLLLTASLMDWRNGRLPNGIPLLTAGNVLLFACLGGDPVGRLARGLLGSAVLVGPLLVLVLLADRLLDRETMGGGDLKLLAAVGLYVSWREALFLLLVASAIGLALALLRRERTVPFAPAVAAGTVLALLTAEPALQWYTQFL